MHWKIAVHIYLLLLSFEGTMVKPLIFTVQKLRPILKSFFKSKVMVMVMCWHNVQFFLQLKSYE